MDYTRCAICGISDEWNGKKLMLQMDHINGVNTDHRLENLRFVCPNCHSQTDTFSNKRGVKEKIFEEKKSKSPLEIEKSVRVPKEKKTNMCISCGNPCNRRAVRCRSCSYKAEKKKKFSVSVEHLSLLVKEKPLIEIGKMFGVSDNAIRKRCKLLNIPYLK
jgi:hypothetical protein